MPQAPFWVCVALLVAGPAAGGDLCPGWTDGRAVGVLDERLIPEASGLAVSRDGSRLYHVNDSGGGPFVYASDLDGGRVRRIQLQGANLQDSEALAAFLLEGEPAIVVGDIGDNRLRRPYIELLAVRERDLDGDRAAVRARVRARYPDGPHNAEALAAGPDGALYVFTKSWNDRAKDAASSRVYRLPETAWESPEEAVLDLVGELDLPALATRERALFSDVVTDVSMSRDGSRFLVLTYGYAWEFALDLASGALPPTEALERGRDYQLIRLEAMLAKETITYLPGDRAFLFGKEFKPDSKPSQLIRIDCRTPAAAR